jgi:hypothetical protein
MTDYRLNTQPSEQWHSTGYVTSIHETDRANRKPGMSPRFSILFQAPHVHIQSPSADKKPISASSAVPKFKIREIMTILCAVQELFLPTVGYLNFKLRLQSVFSMFPDMRPFVRVRVSSVMLGLYQCIMPSEPLL